MSDLWLPETLEDYEQLDRWLASTRAKSISAWEEAMRWYSLHDLFFMVNRVLSTKAIVHSQYQTPFYFHQFYLDLCKLNQWYIDDKVSSYDGSARRGGKALSLDTPVITKAGWKRHGDLAVGDVLYDERGEECSVVATSQVWTDIPCYMVLFDNGCSVTAAGPHEWIVKTDDYTKDFVQRCETESIFLSGLKFSIPYPRHLGDGSWGPELGIKSINPVGCVPVSCIEVDSPSHLYLAGDGMIPTSNSTVRTFAGSIQIGLRWPESSQCIFSVERKLSRKHLRMIKEELETNKLLKSLFSDVLWDDPIEATKTGDCVWSLDDGLRFRRTRVRPTQTIEQQAYMRGAPTGAGYDVLHFDDAENESVIATPDLIETLHDSFASAVNLATPAVFNRPIIFVTNTLYSPKGIANLTKERYEAADPKRVRIVPAEDLAVPGDGPLGGTPRYPFTAEILQQKYDEMTMRAGGKIEYAVQNCCSFLAGEERTFDPHKIQWTQDDPRKLARNKNVYVCVDTSKGMIDPTGIFVWALGADKRKYWVGGTRKKLDPGKGELGEEIFNQVMTWSNLSERVVEVRVEQIAQMTWAELISSELRARGCYVPVIACSSRVRKTGRFSNAKQEREWACWAPPLEAGELVFPRMLKAEGEFGGGWGIKYKDDKGVTQDLVEYFVENELGKFPRAAHDDLLDAGALLWDADANEERPLQYPSMGYGRIYGKQSNRRTSTTWMSA